MLPNNYHCNNLLELAGQLIYDTKCKYWQVVLKLGVCKYIKHNNSNSVIEFPFKGSIYIVYTALKEVEVVV